MLPERNGEKQRIEQPSHSKKKNKRRAQSSSSSSSRTPSESSTDKHTNIFVKDEKLVENSKEADQTPMTFDWRNISIKLTITN